MVFQSSCTKSSTLNSPLYIGNAADYAGYAVNNPQAKLLTRGVQNLWPNQGRLKG